MVNKQASQLQKVSARIETSKAKLQFAAESVKDSNTFQRVAVI